MLRIVVRAGMHRDMADQLLDALREKTEIMEKLTEPLPDAIASHTQAFAH